MGGQLGVAGSKHLRLLPHTTAASRRTRLDRLRMTSHAGERRRNAQIGPAVPLIRCPVGHTAAEVIRTERQAQACLRCPGMKNQKKRFSSLPSGCRLDTVLRAGYKRTEMRRSITIVMLLALAWRWLACGRVLWWRRLNPVGKESGK